LPCPGRPRGPAAEENRTNASRCRSRVSSSRWTAASALGASTRSSRSTLNLVIASPSTMPAVWMTAVSGASAGTRGRRSRTWSRSAQSQARIEQQVAEAMFGGQVAGDGGAEGAGAASDQDRARGVEGAGQGILGAAVDGRLLVGAGHPG